ncbi:unnamed protein product [Laminaria digitata]
MMRSRGAPANALRALLAAAAANVAAGFFVSGQQSCSPARILLRQRNVGSSTAIPKPAAAADGLQAQGGAGETVGEGAGAASNAFAQELGVLDEEQAAMMAEECILVDRNDRPTGSASKVETHLSSRGLLLHRAFSVFLFDRKGRVLMQRRADSKHTFAGYWTNTCCSHPLWNGVEMGTDMTTPKGDKMASEGDAAVAGAMRAAVRKLGQELGIPAAQLPLEDFSFLTKVHYIASSGSTWGEHEIDYVYLIQADVDLDPNPNEVSDAEFLDREGLRSLLASAERGEVKFTPWSAYIIDRFVFGWWDHVGDKGKLETYRDDIIHRVGSCADEGGPGG